MFRYLTAGESHGPALVGILDGLPAGLRLDVESVNRTLALRQGGYGRGARMKIERDEMVRVLSDPVISTTITTVMPSAAS